MSEVDGCTRSGVAYSVPVMLKVVVGLLCANAMGSQWSYMPDPALEGGVETVPVAVVDVVTEGELGVRRGGSGT